MLVTYAHPHSGPRALFSRLLLRTVLPNAGHAVNSRPLSIEQVVLQVPDNRQLTIETVARHHGDNLTVIVFSHGANAAPDRYRAIIDQWARAGFVVISPLHIDSEDHPQRETVDRGRVLRTRIEDIDQVVTAVADRRLFGRALAERVGAGPIIAAGHSYGAYIAQIAAGASVIDPGGGQVMTGAGPTMIGAVVAVSPPPSRPGFNPPESWSSLVAPMLVVTGTADILPGFAPRWEEHLDSFHAAPADSAWAAIYTDVDHYFGGAICRLTSPPDALQQMALDRLAALSIRFMRASGTLSDATSRNSFENQLSELSDSHLIRVP